MQTVTGGVTSLRSTGQEVKDSVVYDTLKLYHDIDIDTM